MSTTRTENLVKYHLDKIKEYETEILNHKKCIERLGGKQLRDYNVGMCVTIKKCEYSLVHSGDVGTITSMAEDGFFVHVIKEGFDDTVFVSKDGLL